MAVSYPVHNADLRCMLRFSSTSDMIRAVSARSIISDIKRSKILRGFQAGEEPIKE